jgi:hypothetical protein
MIPRRSRIWLTGERIWLTGEREFETDDGEIRRVGTSDVLSALRLFERETINAPRHHSRKEWTTPRGRGREALQTLWPGR